MDTIDVRMDAEGRCDWKCLAPYRKEVRATLTSLLATVGVENLSEKAKRVVDVDPPMLEEAEQIARIAGVRASQVIAMNSLYDLASFRFGCTAFAARGTEGPVHAHCLDWEVGARVLRQQARPFRFYTVDGEMCLISVGWPGLLGVYVGFSPRRYSLTLNAVWSEDPPLRALPLALVLRRLMTQLRDYSQLIAALMQCELACSCLLLVTGTQPKERVLIERTPCRAGLRAPTDDDVLVVTNHYQSFRAGMSLPGYVASGDEPFGLGTHERLRLATELLRRTNPRGILDCHAILEEEPFTHKLTILRTTMCAASGEFRWTSTPAKRKVTL